MSDQLRPCPFCGTADIELHRDVREAPISAIWCNHCGGGVDDSTACVLYDEHLITRWNTRAHLPTDLSEERARQMTEEEAREMLAYDPDTIIETMRQWGFVELTALGDTQ